MRRTLTFSTLLALLFMFGCAGADNTDTASNANNANRTTGAANVNSNTGAGGAA